MSIRNRVLIRGERLIQTLYLKGGRLLHVDTRRLFEGEHLLDHLQCLDIAMHESI